MKKKSFLIFLLQSSDFRHSVTTPAMLIMSRYLSLLRIRSAEELCSNLFVCTLMLDYNRQAKRYMPELVRFLRWLFSVWRSAITEYVGKKNSCVFCRNCLRLVTGSHGFWNYYRFHNTRQRKKKKFVCTCYSDVFQSVS